MSVTRLGFGGLALTMALAAPQAADATASFDITGNFGVELAAPIAPGTAAATMVYQAFSAAPLSQSGDSGFAFTSTNFNATPPLASAPQDGVIFSTDLGGLNAVVNAGRPTLGVFRVNFSGFANSAPGVGANLSVAGTDSFGVGSSAAQTFEFVSEQDETLDLVISPVVRFNDLSADPGEVVTATGRYLIDDLFTQGVVEYIVTVFAELDGLGGIITTAELCTGATNPNATACASTTEMLINAGNTVVNPDGSPIGIPVATFVDSVSPWKFSFEGVGLVRALPGEVPPTSDVPVPAALPLLASALGGLFWMRRRKAA